MTAKRLGLLFICLCLILATARAQQPNVAVRETSNDTTKIAVIEERLRGLEVALELQAKEYARRLDDLNHAHEKQVADQNEYLNKAVFTEFVKGSDAWRAASDKRLTVIEASTSGATGFKDSAISIGMALIALAGFIFMFLTRRRLMAGRDERP